MKTYHFDIADGVRLEDPVGIDCNSDGDARAKADAIARQIAEDMGDRERRAVIVVDDSGAELYRVPITTGQLPPVETATPDSITARTTVAKD